MMYSDANSMANDLKEINTESNSFRMATITGVDEDNVYLTFYGEETQRVKSYKRLSSYSPSVNDTVICAKLNNTYTILGKVM